ncbi:carbohydrate kinase [Synechococcus sp. RSCCF101]|uniref:carbohydrate kinase family protein n=1 Tax=Synechococcus sp. RSCCF101 TaxID=2511069 RepID=UPI001245A9E2|nr:carbohydrate kinase [Synechococcus sp. RSCCF101]QEY32492.1 carbohydrate kinase [Synechococcus sp. RSCCF101]
MSPAAAPALVICLGEALIDRLGPPGGDVRIGPSSDCLGGAPANVACALARLGTDSALVARLGQDDAGRRFRALFQQRGVRPDGLQADPDRPTRVVLVSRDAAGERCFGGFMGDRGAGFADQALNPDALQPVLEALLPRAAWLLVGTIPMAGGPAARAHALAMAMAEAAGVPIAMDVNWRPTFWPCSAAQARHPILAVLPRVAVLKLAAEEAEWLFASRDPVVVHRALPRRPDQACLVVISDGSRPVRWSNGRLEGACPALAVPVRDTTGAGDAFTAGLLHRLAEDPGMIDSAAAAPLEEAIRFASACGALTCGGEGAIEPQPDADAVRALLQR